MTGIEEMGQGAGLSSNVLFVPVLESPTFDLIVGPFSGSQDVRELLADLHCLSSTQSFHLGGRMLVLATPGH